MPIFSAMERALSHDRLHAVTEAQHEIASTDLDAQEVMSLVARRARSVTGADAAVVELGDGEVVYHSAGESSAGFFGHRLDPTRGAAGLGFDPEEVLNCGDARTDPRVDYEAAARAGAVSIVSVPLRHRGRVIGALKIYACCAGAFDEDDVRLLQLLAGLLSAHLAEWIQIERRQVESIKDALTGLSNLRAFEERLGAEVARTRRHGGRLALCLVDVDQFHEVNETLGSAVGDEVLRGVARNLACVRGEDEAFRLGSDEFAVIFPEVGAAGASTAACRLAAAVEGDRGCGGVTVSWGVAELDGGDPAALVAQAKEALDHAKRVGNV